MLEPGGEQQEDQLGDGQGGQQVGRADLEGGEHCVRAEGGPGHDAGSGKVEVNILYMGRNLLIKGQVLWSRHSSTMKARHEKRDMKEYMITKNRVAVF